jgi:diacylglycerol kinase (ATP)
MYRRARLIYNPTAGREMFVRQLPRILERLEQAGLETSCHATREPGQATIAARQASERGFDVVIAAGGDGTVHEVVTGISQGPHRPILGVLPCGTTNDFARGMGLPRDLLQACDVIGDGFVRTVDAGRVGDRLFVNVAAVGDVTAVTYEAPSRLKTLVGPLAYYLKGLEKIGSLSRSFPVRIEADGRQWEEDILLMMVANTRSVGGFEQLAPKADLNDGKLDVIVVRKTSIADLIPLVRIARKGGHIYDPSVLYFQARHLYVESDEPLRWNLDGELGGILPGICEALPGHLRVLCPRPAVKDRTEPDETVLV